MTTETNTVAPFAITPDFFFSALEKWKEWVYKGKVYAEARLAIAETKPREAQSDLNLGMDAQGRIWAGHGPDGWKVLTRSSSEPFAYYMKGEVQKGRSLGGNQGFVLESGEQVIFVKRSLDCYAEDWAWEVKQVGDWLKRGDEAGGIRRGLQSNLNGLQLAEILLAKKAEIEAWLPWYVGHQRFGFHNDWKDILQKFAPEFVSVNVPDNGSVLCALHMVLDQMEFGFQIRTYAS